MFWTLSSFIIIAKYVHPLYFSTYKFLCLNKQRTKARRSYRLFCQSDSREYLKKRKFQIWKIYLFWRACVYRVPRGNVPDFRRMFLKLKYTDIAQNTYIQSWTVTEIMAREVWKYGSCYTLIDYQIHIKTGRNMWFL